jgi:ribosomal protein S21
MRKYVGNSRPTEDAVPYKPLEVIVIHSTARVSEEFYKDCFYRALSAFRAKVQKEKVLSHYKMAHVFESPSEYKRRKKNESRRKQMETMFLSVKKEKVEKPKKEYTSDYDLFE